MALTPSQLLAEIRNTPTITNDFGELQRKPSATPKPVDSFGNQMTGKGANARPVIGNPNTTTAPPSPNGPATNAIKTAPVRQIPPATGSGGAAGSLRAALMRAVTSPKAMAGGGVGMMLYPSELGDGTLNTPEAQKLLAENEFLRANKPIQDKLDALNAAAPPITVSPFIPSVAASTPPATPAGTLLQSKPRDPTAEQAKNLSFMGQKIGQGYTPIAPEDTTLVRTQNGVTDYQTPKGSITMPENGVLGVPSRQGGGTLSVLSGRTPEEQALIDARVDSLKRQTEALRQYNIDTGRSYAPRSLLAVPTAEPVDLFARPGDRFGDSQLRQAQFEGLLKEAASGRNVGGGRRGRARDAEQRKAMIDAAQGLLTPGLGAAEMQGRQQASRDSLLGQLAQVGATQSATQQRRQASREQLALDQHKANQEQQIKGGELTLNALKTYQGMGEAQQQQAKADLYQAYADAVNQGDQAMISKLQPLMDYLYPQKQQNDALATLLQQTQK